MQMLNDLLHHPRKALFDPLARFLSRRTLREFMQNNDLASIVDTPRQYRGRGFYGTIRYIQLRSEILELADAVSRAKPTVIVEIGGSLGGTLFVFCRSNPQAELIVSIDLPNGPFGGGGSRQLSKFYSEFLFDRPKTRLEIIRDDSHANRTVGQLEHLLKGRQIDFLYIDADHTYEGVSQDFALYSRFVAPGGHIAFHDIYSDDLSYGVPRLWKELASRYPTVEFRDGPDSIMGNGMLTFTSPLDSLYSSSVTTTSSGSDVSRKTVQTR